MGNYKLVSPKSGYSGYIAFEWLFQGVTYWVSISREFFRTFNVKYPNEPVGAGVSCELVLLEHVIKKDPLAVMLLVTGDRKFYCYGAKDWLDYAYSHFTISDFASKETGMLASIPVGKLKRWYPNNV